MAKRKSPPDVDPLSADELAAISGESPFSRIVGLSESQRDRAHEEFLAVEGQRWGPAVNAVVGVLNESRTLRWKFQGCPDVLVAHGRLDPKWLEGVEDCTFDSDEEAEAAEAKVEALVEFASAMWTAWNDRRFAVAEIQRAVEQTEELGRLLPGLQPESPAFDVLLHSACPYGCHRRAERGPYGLEELVRKIGLPPYGPGCRCGLTPAAPPTPGAWRARSQPARPDNAGAPPTGRPLAPAPLPEPVVGVRDPPVEPVDRPAPPRPTAQPANALAQSVPDPRTPGMEVRPQADASLPPAPGYGWARETPRGDSTSAVALAVLALAVAAVGAWALFLATP